ncbi:MAG: type II toxin-antitoxin system VapC family toxin [Stellaceae bacterium]
MRITADTNILVRAAVDDAPAQTHRAQEMLRDAEIVALTLPALCEFVWVARSGYHRSPREIVLSLRGLISAANVVLERAAVEAGLACLDAGGDFADGVIAFAGRQLGGTVFASFDRRAVELIAAAGGEAQLLGG